MSQLNNKINYAGNDKIIVRLIVISDPYRNICTIEHLFNGNT